MQLLDVAEVGTKHRFIWPSGDAEVYDYWVDYRARAADGEHRVRIGLGTRECYGKKRKRVVVWIDGHPHAEFLGADDFDVSGEVLAEIKVPGDRGERICRYREEPIPERYSGLNVTGLPTRVSGPGVHGAWAVVAHVADHKSLAVLASLRRVERDR